MKTTSVSAVLPSQHADYVSAIAFDHYGRKIATCSADRQVHIWDLDDNGQWVLGNSISAAHYSGVSGVSWSHPEFGQLLVTSGHDGVAIVWEERTEELAAPTHSHLSEDGGGGAGSAAAAHSRWVERVRLTDARRALSCVKFAPRHLGLTLATGSADGYVRIYEAVDAMNLAHWLLKNSFEVVEDVSAPSAGTTANTPSPTASTHTGLELGVRCLDWCTGRFEGPALVVGGSLGSVQMYKYSDTSRSWILYMSLEPHVTPNGLRRGVLDVAWAPNVGRSFHLIASCGRDGVLRVSKLKRIRKDTAMAETQTDAMDTGNSSNGGGSQPIIGYDFDSSQRLESNGSEVWKCAWNITGTVLAASGDFGFVSLWKADHKNIWKCVSEVEGEMKVSITDDALEVS